MKKLILIVALMMSAVAQAASPEVLKAVLDSDSAKVFDQILKIEVTAAGRCPDCYEIMLSGSNILGEASVLVETRRAFTIDASGNYVPSNVEVIEKGRTKTLGL